VPKDVGIAVEVAGAQGVQFAADQDAELQTDTDEEGGFCFVRPSEPGLLNLNVLDALGRESVLLLSFTEPIERLIRARAAFIASSQVCTEPGSPAYGAVLPYDHKRRRLMQDPDSLANPEAIESGLCDALFLVEKNALYPDEAEIGILDRFVREYLQDDLQNPGDGAIGSMFPDTRAAAYHYGRPLPYVLAACFFHSMWRLKRIAAETQADAEKTLLSSWRTAKAMFANAVADSDGPGIRGIVNFDDLATDLRREGHEPAAEELESLLVRRAHQVIRRLERPGIEWVWNREGLEEAAWAARRTGRGDWLQRILRVILAGRALSPAWWTFGSDARMHSNSGDRAETYLGHSTTANSRALFAELARDYDAYPDALVRLAYGGLAGVWALVNPDGSASEGFCPDPLSKRSGFAPTTGDLGFALYDYLRGACSWVLPSRDLGDFPLGCHFESDVAGYRVRPWDGVGRRAALRQIGFEVELGFGRLRELRLDSRKRSATMTIENPWHRQSEAEVKIRGLWGRTFEAEGRKLQTMDGTLRFSATLPAGGCAAVSVREVGE
jgi:hypothetical protein